MKTLLALCLFTLLTSCEFIEQQNYDLNTDNSCSSNTPVAQQVYYSGELLIQDGKPIAQSFTVNCSDGVLNSLNLILSSSESDTTTKVKVEIYGESDDNGNFSSLVDEAEVDAITDTAAVYLINFSSGFRLEEGHTYWIVLSTDSSTSTVVRTSSMNDTYTEGDLYLTNPYWLTINLHRDIYFRINIQND